MKELFGKLPCIKCGEYDASIGVDLIDGELRCQECEETFTIDEIEEIVERWSPVAKWLEMGYKMANPETSTIPIDKQG